MVVLDDFLRSFRKFNCSVFLATQHLSLPLELRASIFANCSRFVAFASSAADADFLGKEFGGPEGALVAGRLPELRTGHAFVKVRGEPVRLLRVSPVDCKVTQVRMKQGAERCLRPGASREQIDREIEERFRRFSSGEGRAHGGPSVANQNDTFPEGYDGY
jgi:hypothetical protein